LPSCRQHLGQDGEFRYLGGETPLDGLIDGLFDGMIDGPLDRRAKALAEKAVRAIGPAQGYVGVDLVLGAAADGSSDAVIEVNPRLTTSYVGTRQLARENLAAAMLAVARGESPPLSFLRRKVEFTPEGRDFP
jgi:predicted ATP-grasp superfamily ATP-dependent carboligase